MRKLSNKDRKLIAEAKRVAKAFFKEKWFCNETQNLKNISTVGAALILKDGKIFSGPNIYHSYSSGASICAEYTAVAKAYSEGHREIDTIVAYRYKNKNKQSILPPCGQCRELLRLFGNPWVIIEKQNKITKEKLSNLLPY